MNINETLDELIKRVAEETNSMVEEVEIIYRGLFNELNETVKGVGK